MAKRRFPSRRSAFQLDCGLHSTRRVSLGLRLPLRSHSLPTFFHTVRRSIATELRCNWVTITALDDAL